MVRQSMNDLRDFLNWFDGFAENIDKTPSAKQWAKIKERVAALRDAPPASTAAAPKPAAAAPPPPAPKAKPVYPFIIDEQGYARKGKGDKRRITPDEVTDALYDLRGLEGDMATIRWADDSTGLNGRDLTIVAA